jgi:hypothetical protein
MGSSYLADSYLLWIAKFDLDITHKEVAGQLLLGHGSYDLANRDVD